jgi:AraC family transcriptional regulator of adaptative response / DNA-3-methyladenine glycosylase II
MPSDIGVLRALRALAGTPELTPREAARLAERWRPWRAYALAHLWASLGVEVHA